MELNEALDIFISKGKWAQAFECAVKMDRSDLLVLRSELTDAITRGKSTDIDILRKTYEFGAKTDFEDFCIAHEWDVQNKLYLPRRMGLKPVVKALQRLKDNELDLLCISLPPGVGKSGTAIYFMNFLAGIDPTHSILGSSHNASFLRGVYDEVLKEITSEEYAWKDIFKRTVVRTNALNMKIDIDKMQRFPTLEFASIGAGLAGNYRAQKLLYCDDLIEDGEEALNEERLQKKWAAYTTDLKQRKQGNCAELHIATRWSVRDVIGRLEMQNENNPRAEFINIPALNEKDESNFDYGTTIGFTTEFYHSMRRTMDKWAFASIYMGKPFERDGLLYQKEQLRRYLALPEGDPDAIMAVCDTSDGRGDDTVMPIGYVYGNDHYIVDVVCTDALPEVTDGILATKIVEHKVKACRFESNAAGGRTADKVFELALSKGHKCNITKKYTTANKETKISVNAAWVKEHCLFKDASLFELGSVYDKFLNKLCSYTLKGKNKHDDVPDAMAQYAIFADSFSMSTVTVGKRFF